MQKKKWKDTTFEGFAQPFYNSPQWKACRKAYAGKVGYLCEMCLKEDKVTPCEIIHHITPLTPNNIHDESITLNFDNLMAVCRHHHEQLHGSKPYIEPRYTIDENGRPIIRPTRDEIERSEKLETSESQQG